MSTTSSSSHNVISELRSILKFHNRYTGTFTCVGYAPSQRRRCRNPIAGGDQAAVEDILRQLLEKQSNNAGLEATIRELARLALCKRDHQIQAPQIARKWHGIIIEEINRLSISLIRVRTTYPSRASIATSSVETRGRHSRPRRHIDEPPNEVRNRPQHLTERTRYGHNVASESTTVKTITTITDESNECRICCEPYEDPCRTPCGHRFCRQCISEWLKNHSTCPHDRRPLRLVELTSIETATAEDSICTICYEDLVEPCRTPCGHIFCRPCISRWLSVSSNKTCPCDRRPLRVIDLVLITDS